MIGYKTIEEFTLEECIAFLERTDISEENRQCAEKRKEYLMHMPPPPEPEPRDILKEHPECKFVPLSSKPILPFWFWCPVFFPIWLGIIFIAGAFLGKYVFEDLLELADLLGDTMGWVISLIISIIIIIKIYRLKKKKARRYFVEDKRDKVLRITDSRKYGLFNRRSSRIVVPVEYDELEWNENNELFEAEKNREHFRFDIHGDMLN